jgi:class 3 adenylate cyclase
MLGHASRLQAIHKRMVSSMVLEQWVTKTRPGGTTMNTCESPEIANEPNASVSLVSGREPVRERPLTAGRMLPTGGDGLGLVGAIPAPVDAGAPTRVPGPGADVFVATLVRAIRIAQAEADHFDGGLGRGRNRENVTLLFTDLVGWTHLATRVGEDSADELLRRHFSTLHRAIVSTGGTEVKRLGDGVMAAFSIASAALDCAVMMQRDVDNDNRATVHPLGLRVGLSGGEVIREATDYCGGPAIEAARLCAAAPSGKILASQVVKAVVGRWARYPYRALGPVELKGLPEPLETFEVIWDPAPLAIGSAQAHVRSGGPLSHLRRSSNRGG